MVMLILYRVFLTWLFLEILYYVRIPKQIFNCEKLNYITISDCSEAAVHSHPFSKVSPENTGGRALLLVKLQTDCLEQRFYTRMTSPRIFSWKYFLSFQSALISQIVNILGKFIFSSKGDILWISNICLYEANLSWNHFFQFPGNF